MLDYLISLDLKLFKTINSLHNPFCDKIMIYISSSTLWIPLYAFLFWKLIFLYKKKNDIHCYHSILASNIN